MKFIKTYPSLGDKKTKTFFAFLPFTHELYINGKRAKETRWLEFVTVEYMWNSEGGSLNRKYKWVVYRVIK